jgi:hypothetical protein
MISGAGTTRVIPRAPVFIIRVFIIIVHDRRGRLDCSFRTPFDTFLRTDTKQMAGLGGESWDCHGYTVTSTTKVIRSFCPFGIGCILQM